MVCLYLSHPLDKKVSLSPKRLYNSSTRLGGWHCKPLRVNNKNYILCIAEKRLLSIVVNTRSAKSLASKLRNVLAIYLENQGVEPELVRDEISEMNSVTYSASYFEHDCPPMDSFLETLWALNYCKRLDLTNELKMTITLNEVLGTNFAKPYTESA